MFVSCPEMVLSLGSLLLLVVISIKACGQCRGLFSTIITHQHSRLPRKIMNIISQSGRWWNTFWGSLVRETRRGHKSPQEAVCPVRNSQQLQTWFRGDNRGEDDWEVTVQKTSMEEVSVDSATASVGTKLGGILCSRKEQRTAVKVFQNGKCVFALFPTGLSCSWLKLACDRHYQTLNPTNQVFFESAQPWQTISKAGLEGQVRWESSG